MPPGHFPQVGDLICGKYAITAVLGRGGMGAVFRAVHSVTGKPFALKWLLPEIALSIDGRRRMIREARAASKLKHPAIVEIYDIEEHESGLFLVMELLEGESLHERLQREGPMMPEDACRLLLPCMRGIARAHAVGIVHRDLKPANVFLCASTDETDEFAKVVDFGISRVTDEVGGESQSTQPGTILGTPHYMAPEQLQGRPAQPSSDVYAFGVLLYETVSGRRPFEGSALAQLMLSISFESPAPLQALRPALPPAFTAVVHRALERDLGRRFRSMTEMVQALEAALQPREREQARVAVARRRRPGWTLWTLSLLVLLGLGFAGREWLSHSRRGARAQRSAPEAVLPRPEPATIAGAGMPAPPPSAVPGAPQLDPTRVAPHDAERAVPQLRASPSPRRTEVPPPSAERARARADTRWRDAARNKAGDPRDPSPVADDEPIRAQAAAQPPADTKAARAGQPPDLKLDVSDF